MKFTNTTTFAVLLLSASTQAIEPFEKFEPIVEINASDGDVGFHFLIGGGPFTSAVVLDPGFAPLVRSSATRAMRAQGMSELFMESAEPKCWSDPEAGEDELIRTVADFVGRFQQGPYFVYGKGQEGEVLFGAASFSHELPAAPITSAEVIDTDSGTAVQISWETGNDLGNCEFSDANIPDPATVEVVRWEIAFEPDIDELPANIARKSSYTVQLPGESRTVAVPAEFLSPWLDAGVTEFKYEIGAKSETGNQTFTERAIEIGN